MRSTEPQTNIPQSRLQGFLSRFGKRGVIYFAIFWVIKWVLTIVFGAQLWAWINA